MPHKFDTYILIPTSRNLEKIIPTLQSLQACKSPRTERTHILIIENGERKGISKHIESLSSKNFKFEYVFSPLTGKSAALNFAIRNHTIPGSFLIMTDDDVTFNENWILNYIEIAKKKGEGHFFGSSFNTKYEGEPDIRKLPLLPSSARGLSDDFYRERPDYLFLGFNWAAFKSDISRAGMFDTRFGPGSTTGATGQETEMQNRLVKNGVIKVFIPNNSVTHFVESKCFSPLWIKKRIERDALSRCLRIEKPLKFFLFYLIFFPMRPLVFGLNKLSICTNSKLCWRLLYFNFIHKNAGLAFRNVFDLKKKKYS